MKLLKLPLKIQKIFLVSDLQTTYYKTPIGTAKIVGNKNGIQSISVVDDIIENTTDIPPCLQNCVSQLDEYFKGNRKKFDLKLNPKGTEFQKKVWSALTNIPFNKTRSYLEQSKQLGDVKAIRAVATANGANAISIIVPCHRIIGSTGEMVGYAGGISTKRKLLELEYRNTDQSQNKLF